MEDLRVIKTKGLIKGAFIELVEEKGYDHVSVKDICNKALINRNTFYLHYYDKVDLLTKMAEEIFMEQENRISFVTNINNISKESIRLGLLDIFKVLSKEIEFYRVILLDSSMSGFIEKFVNDLKASYVKTLNINSKDNLIILDYVFYGISGVIKNWIIKDYGKIEDLAEKLSEILYNNIINFIK